jgi:parallel beta-helix repeat protein
MTIAETTSSYSPHPIIVIDGNDGFTPENGVVRGSGTEIDPYVIEGWSIGSTATHSVWIMNTDACFVIRECQIYGPGGGGIIYDGVRFERVANGSVVDTDISGRYHAIYMNDCSNMSVERTKLLNSANRGLVVHNSDGLLIDECQIACEYEPRYAIYIDFSSNITISDNNLTYDLIGVYLVSCQTVLILGNEIHRNENHGILAYDSNRVVIIENNVTFSANAVYFTGTMNTAVYHNNFWNMTYNGFGEGSTNRWDNGYPYSGNFWSNYSGVDLYNGPNQNVTGSDGIGDTPFNVRTSSWDRYPLMKPHVRNFPPTTACRLTVVLGWNFVTIPLVDHGYKASTLGLDPGDIISMWDSTTQTYRNCIVGVPTNDFAIAPSTGYWINVPSGTRTLLLVGSLPTTTQQRYVDVPIGGGWTVTGFVGFNTTRHAADMSAMYSTPGGITIVASWNPATKAYTTWLSIIPSVNNFLLVPGQAYWILCGTSGVLTYCP